MPRYAEAANHVGGSRNLAGESAMNDGFEPAPWRYLTKPLRRPHKCLVFGVELFVRTTHSAGHRWGRAGWPSRRVGSTGNARWPEQSRPFGVLGPMRLPCRTGRRASGLDVIADATGFGYGQTVFAQPVDVKPDSRANLSFDFFNGRAGGHAAWKVWNVCRIVVRRLLDDDCVLHDSHSLSCACLRMLFSVPGARSSLGFPATVTRPFFVGCLNCRWLPLVAAKYQPSFCKSRITSRTLAAKIISLQSRPAKQTPHATYSGYGTDLVVVQQTRRVIVGHYRPAGCVAACI